MHKTSNNLTLTLFQATHLVETMSSKLDAMTELMNQIEITSILINQLLEEVNMKLGDANRLRQEIVKENALRKEYDEVIIVSDEEEVITISDDEEIISISDDEDWEAGEATNFHDDSDWENDDFPSFSLVTHCTVRTCTFCTKL